MNWNRALNERGGGAESWENRATMEKSQESV
jgi:hypothetical protein